MARRFAALESKSNPVEDGTVARRRFPIVGIGASAGGLEALERFFRHVPPDSGMAFVVLQHLSPDFESRMDELLARQTVVPIHRVTDGLPVTPDAIYVLPPRKDMIIASGRLLLTDKDPERGLSLPIDHFFRSLAHDAGPYAAGIVLSGTGSDGSRGIREIHGAGGFVICQSEETARFDGMPRSARNTGVVDLVLAPEEMPDALQRHAAAMGRPSEPGQDAPLGSTHGMATIFKRLRTEYGIDFAHYKPSTVTRRVERRLSLAQDVTLDAYVERLREDPAELDALYRDLLIGVTEFFRDREAFDLLARDIVPALIDKADGDEPIRVWVAGCATGEEAYSIAILFHEAFEARRQPPNVKIFATDVHRDSLEAASVGLYPEEALAELTPQRHARYFRANGERFQVDPALRQMIVFARHNVLNDAPFTRLSLVTCRNLLIYLQPPAQKKVLSLFHFGLKAGGILFMGPSETPSDLAEEFEPIDKHWRIYRKRRDIRLPADMRLTLPPTTTPAMRASRTATRWSRSTPDPALFSTYDRLLDRHMPPSLLVDENYDLVHVFGGAERFIRMRRGRPSTHVLDLVAEDLRTSLSGALQHAEKEQAPVRYTGIRVPTTDGEEDLRLTVEPLVDARARSTHFLIVLDSLGERSPQPMAEAEVDVQKMSREYIESLESELRFTKENLQATIEELETSNEELQATNEELVASNEELQSTNEELHSVNEELYTINVEHQKKIAELTELTDDMDNLLQSTDIGVVFLDSDLNIRKFTMVAARLFGLLPHDVGRRFESFAHNLAHGRLLEDLRRVAAEGVPVEREVQDRAGGNLFLRILPYRAKGRASGVVLTLVAIDSLKRAEENVRRLSAIVESSHDAIVGTDLDGTILTWNSGATLHYGYGAAEAVGRPFTFLVPEEQRAETERLLQSVRGGAVVEDQDTVRVCKDGRRLDVAVHASPTRDAGGVVIGVSSIERDITRRKVAEDQVRDAVRQRERFLAVLSHELRNPLSSVLASMEMLEESDPASADHARAFMVLRRQVRHMSRLLDDLLEVSRIQSGKIGIRRERVDLAAVTREVVESLAGSIRGSETKFSADVPQSPVWVDGDPHRLQQIQVNLISNALKYTPAGRAVQVSLAVEGDRAVLRIRDAGRGIPVGGLAHIFEPFVQLENAVDHAQGGMGLGLALTRSIVEAHGGEIGASSEGEGRGAEFTVRLPLASAPAAAAQRRVSTPPAGGRVVLVEDQDDARELLAALLRRRGYDVVTASDGPEGLQAILDGRPDVALVDLGMPTLGGLEVARRVREALGARGPFLVALTGYGQESDREACRAAGFDRHLVKPIDLPDLLEVLAEARRKLAR